jgi:hypothetical protein
MKNWWLVQHGVAAGQRGRRVGMAARRGFGMPEPEKMRQWGPAARRPVKIKIKIKIKIN